MEQNRSTDLTEAAEAVHLQAEMPTAGTALNPLEEGWAFDQNPAAAPVDQLAEAMQQGE